MLELIIGNQQLMGEINHKKVRRNFVIFMVVFVSFSLMYRYNLYKYESKQLKNSQITYGNVLKYSSVMGANYIHYNYIVNDELFEWKVQIRKSDVDSTLIHKNDLMIRYAIDDPSISCLVDPRFE